ncbi:MAG: Omp28-related outer membrane protein [Bacteroidetes bacterium]|nr:Omp28-related outer membrane protein [Bacteroidota bacterium]
MKQLFFLTLLLSLGISSCREVGPDINLKNNENAIEDTTYVESPVQSPEARNVLIEEFTGVRCPNCPQGHVIIANIKAANPGRINSLSLHPINSLGAPYPFSPLDFRSQDAQDLFDYLGQIGLEPAAGINRKLFAGESKILLDKSKWNAKVNDELSVAVPVNIVLESSYDSVLREVTIVTELHYTQASSEQHKLTIALTESNLVTPQLDGATIDTFYVHKDITRAFVTAKTGDLLSATIEPGRVIRKVFKKSLDAGWKPEDMYVIAYVHEFANSKQVLQSKEVELK